MLKYSCHKQSYSGAGTRCLCTHNTPILLQRQDEVGTHLCLGHGGGDVVAADAQAMLIECDHSFAPVGMEDGAPALENPARERVHVYATRETRDRTRLIGARLGGRVDVDQRHVESIRRWAIVGGR